MCRLQVKGLTAAAKANSRQMRRARMMDRMAAAQAQAV